MLLCGGMHYAGHHVDWECQIQAAVGETINNRADDLEVVVFECGIGNGRTFRSKDFCFHGSVFSFMFWNLELCHKFLPIIFHAETDLVSSDLDLNTTE